MANASSFHPAREAAFLFALIALSGCGRARYLELDDASNAPAPDSAILVDAMDAGVAPPLDAPLSDAWLAPDAAMDAYVPRDAFVGPDAYSPFVVTNTNASGPGSLSAVVDYVNTNCGMFDPRITFDIPLTDPGFITVGSNRFWRISAPTDISLTCGRTTIDGTTQTARRGNQNAAVFGGIPVGGGGALLATIQGPEIELRGIAINASATTITLRGLALRMFASSASFHTIEQCLFDSEPTELTPIPSALRGPDNTLVYLPNGPNTVRANAFVWQVGTTNQYNGISMGGAGSTFEENYMRGTGGGGGWDELHLIPAADARVLHNYFGGSDWEFHIEWVTGEAGEVSENTFVGAIPMISMGGAAVMTGNITVP